MKNLIVTASVIVTCLLCVPSAESGTPATVTSPSNGLTFTSTTVQFQWTVGSGVTDYWLVLGKKPGSNEYYTQDRGTNLNATVSGLPSDGTRVYAWLWSLVGGVWQYQETSYIAYSAVQGVPAQMTSPAPGSTFTTTTVQFSWTGGTGASQYWLFVGKAAGGFELYDHDQGNLLSASVGLLPADGSTVYVRLWSFIGAAWQYYDYTYTSVNTGGGTTAAAQMTTPAPSSTLASSTVTFQWTGGMGVSSYWLDVGSSADPLHFYSQAVAGLSATVSGLPTDGSIVYVRLASMINGAWQYNGYTYTASSIVAAKAQMSTPAPSSTLTASTVQFQWTGGTASDFWLHVGTTAGGKDLFNSEVGGLTANVTGLPTNGSTVYVRLWSLLGTDWVWNDYTYTASTTTQTTAPAQMTTPAPGSTLTASTVQFQWTGGTGVSQYWLTIGTTAVGANDVYTQNQGTSLSASVTGLPTNGGTVYVRLWSVINGAWQSNDYTYTATSTTTSSSNVPAQMTTPAPASTLAATTVQFQWNGGTGVSQYWLNVGTTMGGTQVYGQSEGTSLTVTVGGLPANGSTVYVRLWSLIGSDWLFNDYTYTATTQASALAQMTTPAPGSTLAASTVQFQWTGGTGVTQDWLTIGTTAVGANDVYTQNQGTSLSASVMGLPTNGGTVYVRLWSVINGVWQYNDYTYTATH